MKMRESEEGHFRPGWEHMEQVNVMLKRNRAFGTT